MRLKKTLDKRFAMPLDFDFFSHPIYPLIVRLELTSVEKVILCTGDTNATYKLSAFCLNMMQFLNLNFLWVD